MKLPVLLLFLALPLAAARIAFLPFANLTSYKGNWNLGADVPAYAAARLKGSVHTAVPFDSLYRAMKINGVTPASLIAPSAKRALAAQWKADFLVEGEILEFTVRKIVMGEGKYGGVKNYRADIRVKAAVYSYQENGLSASEELAVTKKETNTALNLGRLSDDETLFDTLIHVPFGSPLFEKSVAGGMMREFCEKMEALITRLPQPAVRAAAGKRTIKQAKIVDLRDEDVYINAGSGDQVEIGDMFNVFTPGDSLKDPDTGGFLGYSEKLIGTVQISFVEAEHFSRAKKVEEKNPFKLKDIVRIEK